MLPLIFLPDKIVNRFVNDSWKAIYHELINETKPTWNPIAMSLLNELSSFIEF